MFTLFALAAILLIAMTSIAMANPLDDILGALFHQRRPEAPASSRSILAVARRDVGRRNWTGISRWCGAAMSDWATAATGRRYRIFRAIDWSRVGRPTTAHVGAVAVLRHHVGVVAEVTANGVVLLSGNHQKRVGYGVYPTSSVIAYREVE